MSTTDDGAAPPTFHVATASDFDFRGCVRTFRKMAKLPKANVVFATEPTVVVTEFDVGTPQQRRESWSRAEVGDPIITGSKGEQYTFSRAKFDRLYEDDPADPTVYRSKQEIRVVRLQQNTQLQTSWGTQRVLAGGFACQSVADPTDVYLQDEGAFIASYGPFVG